MPLNVLLTGADGYIGTRMGSVLLERGHRVVGHDAGFHRGGWLYPSAELRPEVHTGDTRALRVEDLTGFDAVVHCGEISNDPLGELDPTVTHSINHIGTVGLATKAKAAGVSRFVHMSSCSVYGVCGDGYSDERSPTEPLTAYATCKLLVERDVGALAGDDFSPTFLRNATAYGASPCQRFDTVVNNLAGWAWTERVLRMESDGTPWRPFVHVLDISKAAACVLEADRDVVHDETFNVGDDRSNYQIRDIARIVSDAVPGCEWTIGDSSSDKRNYRADFTKIATKLPGFSCEWDVERGVEELISVFGRIRMGRAEFESRLHTRLKQMQHLLDTGQVDRQFFWT